MTRSSTVGRGTHGAVTALARHGIHEVLADPDALGADVDEVARQRRLGDLDAVGRRGGRAARSASAPAVDARISTIRCWRAARDVETVIGPPPSRCCSTSHDSSAFCACSRFSASCQTSERGPSMTSASTSWPAVGGQAVQEDGVRRGPCHQRLGDPERLERARRRPCAASASASMAHRDPGVGGDDVGARHRGDRVVGDEHRPALLGRDGLGPGDDVGARRVGCRGADAHVHAGERAAEEVGVRHVVGPVADVGEGQARRPAAWCSSTVRRSARIWHGW